MPVVTFTAQFLSFHQFWDPDPGPGLGGSLLGNIQTAGDGAFDFSSAIPSNALLFFGSPNISPIGSLDTINSVDVAISARNHVMGSASPLLLLVNGITQATLTLADAYATYTTNIPTWPTAGPPDPWSPGNLEASTIGFAVIQPLPNADVDWYGIVVDYTPFGPPPPPDVYVEIWIAGPFPPGAPQPPADRFAPFGIFYVPASLDQLVTDQWRQKFGPPTSGYTVWIYSRTLSSDLVPFTSSALSNYTWP